MDVVGVDRCVTGATKNQIIYHLKTTTATDVRQLKTTNTM